MPNTTVPHVSDAPTATDASLGIQKISIVDRVSWPENNKVRLERNGNSRLAVLFVGIGEICARHLVDGG